MPARAQSYIRRPGIGRHWLGTGHLKFRLVAGRSWLWKEVVSGGGCGARLMPDWERRTERVRVGGSSVRALQGGGGGTPMG